MPRRFLPWVGPAYRAGGDLGLRLLILGEAHYGEEGDETPDFTQRVIREFGQEKRFRFFTRVQGLVQNREGWIPDEERRRFWDGVAFTNFIQEFPGPTARIRPTERMWAEAREPYLATLKELEPELVLILGDELWDAVPDDDRNTPLCGIQHPAYPRFDAARSRADIAKKISEVKASRRA